MTIQEAIDDLQCGNIRKTAQALLDNPSSTAMQISDIVGNSRHNVSDHISRLVKRYGFDIIYTTEPKSAGGYLRLYSINAIGCDYKKTRCADKKVDRRYEECELIELAKSRYTVSNEALLMMLHAQDDYQTIEYLADQLAVTPIAIRSRIKSLKKVTPQIDIHQIEEGGEYKFRLVGLDRVTQKKENSKTNYLTERDAKLCKVDGVLNSVFK